MEKLIAALRSGKYKQGFTHLRDGDGYCVLGVACELYGLKKGGEKGYISNLTGYYETMAPREVLMYLGITDAVAGDLVWMNDTQRLTFKEIADFLEKETSKKDIQKILARRQDSLAEEDVQPGIGDLVV